MHNLDDMIEKYRYELMEFSKQNPVHNEKNNYSDEENYENEENYSDEGNYRNEENYSDEEEYREEEPTMANTVDESENQDSGEVDEFINIQPYQNNEDFERRNGSRGMLKIQASAADGSFPISGADVTIRVPFLTGGTDIFRGVTDVDGIIDNISLPAPNRSLSLDEDNTSEPFALYNITVSHPGFVRGEFMNVPIFDSVKSIQPVELVPLTQNGNEPGQTDFGGVE